MNPMNWSTNYKQLTALVVLVSTIVGSVWSAGAYLGHVVYSYAEVQTNIANRIEGLQSQILRDLGPRITVLEKSTQEAANEAAAAKARVDGIQNDLNLILLNTTKTLSITQSHDDDIKATRAVVAPKPGAIPRGQ